MLQEFLRRGKKWADKPDSNFRECTSAELGVCSRPAWVSAYCGKSSKRTPGKWVDSSVDFCGGFFWPQIAEKSAGKSASRKQTKKSSGTRLPRKSPARPKNLTNKSTRHLQSMDFGTLFGCVLGMVEAPMLKCTCNLSADAGGTRFAAHPSRQHL